jgi:hypothetical protein
MDGTIAPVREIVIVIRDLYLEPQLESPPAAVAAADPIVPPSSGAGAGDGPGARKPSGLEHLTRFGDRRTLPGGWRAWVAHWLGVPQFAEEAPASIAAAAAQPQPPADRAVWLATPVHWVAGLTSLHCDRRSVLRLPLAELEELAGSFRDTFRGSGFDLQPLAGGELLLSGPALAAPPVTTEPARMLLASVAAALPVGAGAPALRRLGAEIEMWLHGHPLNERRARRGAPPVATLWIWGGGRPAVAAAALARETVAAAFGSDAYIRGLWRLVGGESRPMPVDWAAMLGEPRAARALGVVEVADLLHANASWRLADAVAEIDRRLISPSIAALRRGELERLTLLANDRRLSLRASNRWRLWRHMRPARRGVEGLA